ncbi:MAG: alpha/beta hydrolase, partial [Chloroflexota bacterium]
MRRPRLRTVLVALLVVVAALGAGFAWYVQPQALLPEAAASLASTPDVAFTNRDGLLEWAPASGDYAVGLIVYPGAKVPPAAYGPLVQEIAAAGYLVVITPMPFNFAVFDIGAADKVMPLESIPAEIV